MHIKNPTFTRKAGKNNIKIMKKISTFKAIIKRRFFFNIVNVLIFS